MVVLLKDCHELEDSESPADLQVNEPAVKLRKDGRIVSRHAENIEPLQVYVAVQGQHEHLPGGEEGIEGPGAKCDWWNRVRSPCYMPVPAGIKGRSAGAGGM